MRFGEIIGCVSVVACFVAVGCSIEQPDDIGKNNGNLLPGDECPEIYAPVCGCDGVTYDNACFAEAAGASVHHEGECETGGECGGMLDYDCGAGFFCETEPGMCGAEGKCMELPDACTAEYDPVCGCDGVTYSNACDAALHGANVSHEGECGGGGECGGALDVECGPGLFCKSDTCGGSGECVPIGDPICTEEYDPQCGCDGQTYSNACHAEAAGQNIAHAGECGQICGGFAGIACQDGEFCNYRDGSCGIGDQQGICEPIAQACPDIWDPVCGCDGQTYSNDCDAAAAGVSVASLGECSAS